MAAFTMPSPTGGEVVLLAIEDEDLRAMVALTLEIAGYRVAPVDAIANTRAQMQEVHPCAVLVDARDGDGEGWNVLERLQRETSTGTVLVVVITKQPDVIPPEVVRRGAAILAWPFDVADLLRVLAAR